MNLGLLSILILLAYFLLAQYNELQLKHDQEKLGRKHTGYHHYAMVMSCKFECKFKLHFVTMVKYDKYNYTKEIKKKYMH